MAILQAAHGCRERTPAKCLWLNPRWRAAFLSSSSLSRAVGWAAVLALCCCDHIGQRQGKEGKSLVLVYCLRGFQSPVVRKEGSGHGGGSMLCRLVYPGPPESRAGVLAERAEDPPPSSGPFPWLRFHNLPKQIYAETMRDISDSSHNSIDCQVMWGIWL